VAIEEVAYEKATKAAALVRRLGREFIGFDFVGGSAEGFEVVTLNDSLLDEVALLDELGVVGFRDWQFHLAGGGAENVLIADSEADAVIHGYHYNRDLLSGDDDDSGELKSFSIDDSQGGLEGGGGVSEGGANEGAVLGGGADAVHPGFDVHLVAVAKPGDVFVGQFEARRFQHGAPLGGAVVTDVGGVAANFDVIDLFVERIIFRDGGVVDEDSTTGSEDAVELLDRADNVQKVVSTESSC
jgi:hypothetical protein